MLDTSPPWMIPRRCPPGFCGKEYHELAAAVAALRAKNKARPNQLLRSSLVWALTGCENGMWQIVNPKNQGLQLRMVEAIHFRNWGCFWVYHITSGEKFDNPKFDRTVFCCTTVLSAQAACGLARVRNASTKRAVLEALGWAGRSAAQTRDEETEDEQDKDRDQDEKEADKSAGKAAAAEDSIRIQRTKKKRNLQQRLPQKGTKRLVHSLRAFLGQPLLTGDEQDEDEDENKDEKEGDKPAAKVAPAEDSEDSEDEEEEKPAAKAAQNRDEETEDEQDEDEDEDQDETLSSWSSSSSFKPAGKAAAAEDNEEEEKPAAKAASKRQETEDEDEDEDQDEDEDEKEGDKTAAKADSGAEESEESEDEEEHNPAAKAATTVAAAKQSVQETRDAGGRKL
eukprot:s5792_g4.t1